MHPPPAGTSRDQVLAWLEEISLFANLERLVNKFYDDALHAVDEYGEAALEREESDAPEWKMSLRAVQNLKYTAPTSDTAAKVSFSIHGLRMQITPRVERKHFTEWVLPLRFHDENGNEHVVMEHGLFTAWGPDFYREAHLRMDGSRNHQGITMFKFAGRDVEYPGVELLMKPRQDGSPRLHRYAEPRAIDPPVPVHSHVSLPLPPQQSQPHFEYIYKVQNPPGTNPPHSNHLLLADILFFNPHHPTSRTAPMPPDPRHPLAHRVIAWNTHAEPGAERDWASNDRHKRDVAQAEMPREREDSFEHPRNQGVLEFPLEFSAVQAQAQVERNKRQRRF